MTNNLTEFTVNIVSAFVSHNGTRPEDMADLLKKVHGRLTDILKPIQVEASIVPAISIKKSVTRNAIFCLICGEGHKTLKRHLRASHDLDPPTYREMFNLMPDYPLTAPSYSERRSHLAVELGLGRKAKKPEPAFNAKPTTSRKVKKAT